VHRKGVGRSLALNPGVVGGGDLDGWGLSFCEGVKGAFVYPLEEYFGFLVYNLVKKVVGKRSGCENP
jgi:hypothetical protein